MLCLGPTYLPSNGSDLPLRKENWSFENMKKSEIQEFADQINMCLQNEDFVIYNKELLFLKLIQELNFAVAIVLRNPPNYA